MKKSIVILVLFTLQLASAQTQFGIKGGANFSNLTSNADYQNKVLVGVNAGIFAKIPLNKLFAVQPEIYFTTKGSEFTYQNGFIEGTTKFELNYIEVPVLLVVNLTNNFNFHIGPYASYLISSKVKNTSENNFNFEDNINTDDFNTFDAGMALGLGVDVKSFGFGVRYNLGFITVGKEKNYFGTNYTFPDAKNGVINLYISYSIL
jgi:Outer membrane protein beta-barrel domain